MELLKNKVAQYTLVSDGAYGQEETLETIVPDVNPDVLRIICTSSEICMKEKSLQMGKLRVSGEIRSRIFYSAEGDTTVWQVEGVTPFACTVDIEEALPDDTLVASCTVITAQASMLNPRKLAVKTHYSIQAQVFRQSTIELVEGVECKTDDGISTLIESTESMMLTGIPERRVVINEEIRLSGGSVSATDRLYRTELTWTTEDKKVLTNKIMLRGSVSIKAVTISEKDGFLAQNMYNLPFAQIIEADNTDPSDEVAVIYNVMQNECRLASGADGAPVLQCSIVASAQAFVSRKIPLRIMTDLYSTAYESDFDTEEVAANAGDERLSVFAPIGESLQADYPAVRIHDYAVRCECRRPSPGAPSAVGWRCFQIIYETTTGSLCCVNRRIEAEAQLERPYTCGSRLRLECAEPQVTCDEDGAISVSGKGVFVCKCPNTKVYRQVSTLRVNHQACKARPKRGTLILRAYDGKESIWQIAKRYNTTSPDIMAANKITGEGDLAEGRLIIIPYSR